ncbi:hypothetical protein ACM1RC_27615 [Paenibacillus azoreducens]|uniref:hypothetical protein n=1 Tax=Paenibacillus azoreducens TaxID=116718 RepID=UPI0039F628D7
MEKTVQLEEGTIVRNLNNIARDLAKGEDFLSKVNYRIDSMEAGDTRCTKNTGILEVFHHPGGLEYPFVIAVIKVEALKIYDNKVKVSYEYWFLPNLREMVGELSKDIIKRVKNLAVDESINQDLETLEYNEFFSIYGRNSNARGHRLVMSTKEGRHIYVFFHIVKQFWMISGLSLREISLTYGICKPEGPSIRLALMPDGHLYTEEEALKLFVRDGVINVC